MRKILLLAIALCWGGGSSTFLFSSSREISENKILIKKIITAPHYQRYLREQDDIVRDNARLTIRTFLKNLTQWLNTWQRKKELANSEFKDSFFYKIFSQALANFASYLEKLSQLLLSSWLILTLSILLIVLLFWLVWQQVTKYKNNITKEKMTLQDLTNIFETLLAQTLYGKADPKLIPPSLTHRQAQEALQEAFNKIVAPQLTLKQLALSWWRQEKSEQAFLKRQYWLEILQLLEIYCFAFNEPHENLKQTILTTLQNIKK